MSDGYRFTDSGSRLCQLSQRLNWRLVSIPKMTCVSHFGPVKQQNYGSTFHQPHYGQEAHWKLQVMQPKPQSHGARLYVPDNASQRNSERWKPWNLSYIQERRLKCHCSSTWKMCWPHFHRPSQAGIIPLVSAQVTKHNINESMIQSFCLRRVAKYGDWPPAVFITYANIKLGHNVCFAVIYLQSRHWWR